MAKEMESESDYILADVNRSSGTRRSENKVDEETRRKGLTVGTSASLMVGEVAGTGFLALPYAVENTGYIGILFISLMALVCAYTATLLGRCWLMVQERHEEYRGHVRHPYPVMGQIAFGKWGRGLVSFFVNFSMFGAGVVYLILASQNIQDLLYNLGGVKISFCYLLLIVGVILLPFTWLGTPKDFWAMGIAATVATIIASVMLLSAMVLDALGPYKRVPVHHTKVSPLSFFQGLGVMSFAYGGHAVFPTIQIDMKQPSRFSYAAFISLPACAFMYTMVSAPAFVIYGKALDPNVSLTVSPGILVYAFQIFITCHIVCALVIIINPVVQELEEVLKVKKQLSWTRIATRTFLMALMLFVGETVPKFGAVVAFIGGSSMISLSCIFPCVFYLRFNAMAGNWKKMTVPLHIKVLLIEIVAVAIVVGVIATMSAIDTITAPNTFTWPCYVNLTSADDNMRS